MLRQLRDVVRRPRLRRRARGVRVRGLVAGCESQSPRLRARAHSIAPVGPLPPAGPPTIAPPHPAARVVQSRGGGGAIFLRGRAFRGGRRFPGGQEWKRRRAGIHPSSDASHAGQRRRIGPVMTVGCDSQPARNFPVRLLCACRPACALLSSTPSQTCETDIYQMDKGRQAGRLNPTDAGRQMDRQTQQTGPPGARQTHGHKKRPAGNQKGTRKQTAGT